MTTGCLKLLLSAYYLHCDLNYVNIHGLISCCFHISPSPANAMYYHFYVQYLPLVSHKTTELSIFSPSVIKLNWKIKPLSLRILKHHKHNPLTVAIFV